MGAGNILNAHTLPLTFDWVLEQFYILLQNNLHSSNHATNLRILVCRLQNQVKLSSPHQAITKINYRRFLLLPYSKPFKLVFNESLVPQWFQHIQYNEDQATGSGNCYANGKKNTHKKSICVCRLSICTSANIATF